MAKKTVIIKRDDPRHPSNRGRKPDNSLGSVCSVLGELRPFVSKSRDEIEREMEELWAWRRRQNAQFDRAFGSNAVRQG